jgi:hypothetical protein
MHINPRSQYSSQDGLKTIHHINGGVRVWAYHRFCLPTDAHGYYSRPHSNKKLSSHDWFIVLVPERWLCLLPHAGMFHSSVLLS